MLVHVVHAHDNYYNGVLYRHPERERDRARVNQIIKNQPNSIEEQTNKQNKNIKR